LGFAVYIWTDSDQPGAKSLLLVYGYGGWFDENDVLFGEAANTIESVGAELRKLGG
jgi:hypothetical protein